MLFIALVKFKKKLSKEIVAGNLKNIGPTRKELFDTWASTGRSEGTIPS